MRLLALAAAALLATGIATAPAAEARPGWHGGPHHGWHRPPPRRWGHRGPRCRTVWHHGRPVRRCW